MDDEKKEINEQKIIEWLNKDFEDDERVDEDIAQDARVLVNLCDEYFVPQPDLSVYSDGNTVEAIWNLDWLILLDLSDGQGFWLEVQNEEEEDEGFECNFESIENAFQCIRLIWLHIIDQS